MEQYILLYDYDYGWILEEQNDGEWEMIHSVPTISSYTEQDGHEEAFCDAFRYCQQFAPCELLVYGQHSKAVVRIRGI